MPPPQSSKRSLAEIVVDSSLDGVAVMDAETRYLLWNRAMERFTGSRADEVLGKRAFDVFPFLRELGLADAFARALAGDTVTTEGVAYVEPDGTRKVYDRVYAPLRTDGHTIDGVLAIVRDSTSRYAALDALRKSEAELRMAVEAGEIGLWSWDPATDTVVWEDALCTIFGLSPDRAPKTRAEYLRLIHREDLSSSEQRIARGVSARGWSDEYRITRADGAVRWVTSKARVIRMEGREVVLGALFDVTDRKERDERSRATQKLETIGQLTAGIAHNFNNVLMGLLPNLELAAKKAPDDLAPLLRSAEASAQRAAEIVRQLMTYAGSNRRAARRVEDLGELAARTVAFARTTFDRRVTIELTVRAAAAAEIDVSQVEQSLLNLLINARDALDGAKSPPRVEVEVTSVSAGAAELEGRAGTWACLRVSDNGVGMSAETLARIYEPFFTTKEAGKGTGLGLATTHGILRDHGGFIACRSEPGQGATFSLYLPGAVPKAAEPPAARVPQSAVRPREKGTILVVDDDAPVRSIVGLLLEDAGFDVRSAATGEEALHVLADASVRNDVDLVLLDVSMPGISKPVLREKVRELAPRVPVIYLTGYAHEAGDGDEVLQKPVSSERLLSAVDSALAARPAAASI
jgi:PAS domain S-box-containing protein